MTQTPIENLNDSPSQAEDQPAYPVLVSHADSGATLVGSPVEATINEFAEKTTPLIEEITDQEAEFCRLYTTFSPASNYYLKPANAYKEAFNRPDLSDSTAGIKAALLIKSPRMQQAFSLYQSSNGLNNEAVDAQLNRLIHNPDQDPLLDNPQVKLKAIELYNKLNHRFDEAPKIAIQTNTYLTTQDKDLNETIQNFEEELKSKLKTKPSN